MLVGNPLGPPGSPIYGLTSWLAQPRRRRGAASWHFITYQNYSATQALGRWQQLRTAKQYIDTATADVTRYSLPAWGQMKLAKVLNEFPTLLALPFNSAGGRSGSVAAAAKGEVDVLGNTATGHVRRGY